MDQACIQLFLLWRVFQSTSHALCHHTSVGGSSNCSMTYAMTTSSSTPSSVVTRLATQARITSKLTFLMSTCCSYSLGNFMVLSSFFVLL